MRTLSIITLLFASVLLSACASKQEMLTGSWQCTTVHPGGFASSDIFEFSKDGRVKLQSNDVEMHGSYILNGESLTIDLLDVPVPSNTSQLSIQKQTLSATISDLTRSRLQMNISTGHDIHKSACRKG